MTEIVLFWATVFTYAISFCIGLFAFVTGKQKSSSWAIRMLWLGLIFHTLTAIARWVAGGHPPVTDAYELNLTGTWVTMLLFLAFEKIRKVPAFVALIVTPIVFLVLGDGLISRTDAMPMGPSYDSPWLAIHVIFAWTSFGFYAISTGAAFFLILREKMLAWKPALKIPDPESLDIMGYRFIAMGFINHAVMLVSGAIWAKNLWGHYWSWDPLETWSLIAFLFYAFYLHARSFLGWKLKTAAWLAIAGLGIMAISFWGVSIFSPSIHPGP
jgi:cytochrome c-type biogenesis protein CcsB